MTKISLVIVFFLVLAIILCGTGPVISASKTQYYTIGTRDVTGVYFPTGGAISRIVNAKKKEYKMRLTVESTGGSVYNVNAQEEL